MLAGLDDVLHRSPRALPSVPRGPDTVGDHKHLHAVHAISPVAAGVLGSPPARDVPSAGLGDPGDPPTADHAGNLAHPVIGSISTWAPATLREICSWLFLSHWKNSRNLTPSSATGERVGGEIS